MQYLSHVIDQLLHDQHCGARLSDVLMCRLSLDQHGHGRAVGRALLDGNAGRQRRILRIVDDRLLRICARYVNDGLLVQRVVLLLLLLVVKMVVVLLLLLMVVVLVVVLMVVLVVLVVIMVIARREFVHAHRLHGRQHHRRSALRRHVVHHRRRHHRSGLRVRRRHARRIVFARVLLYLHHHGRGGHRGRRTATGQWLLLLLSVHRGRHNDISSVR